MSSSHEFIVMLVHFNGEIINSNVNKLLKCFATTWSNDERFALEVKIA